MKLNQFAAALQGISRDEIGSEINQAAKKAGFVVVHGVSRDAVEFLGAIEGEADVPEGGSIYFDVDGLLPEVDEVEESGASIADYYDRKKLAFRIDAEYQKDGFVWVFTMPFPHSRFVTSSEGERYSRGIVFDLAAVTHKEKGLCGITC